MSLCSLEPNFSFGPNSKNKSVERPSTSGLHQRFQGNYEYQLSLSVDFTTIPVLNLHTKKIWSPHGSTLWVKLTGHNARASSLYRFLCGLDPEKLQRTLIYRSILSTKSPDFLWFALRSSSKHSAVISLKAKARCLLLWVCWANIFMVNRSKEKLRFVHPLFLQQCQRRGLWSDRSLLHGTK